MTAASATRIDVIKSLTTSLVSGGKARKHVHEPGPPTSRGGQGCLVTRAGGFGTSGHYAFFPVAAPCFWMKTFICSRSEVVADAGLNPRHAFRKSKS